MLCRQRKLKCKPSSGRMNLSPPMIVCRLLPNRPDRSWFDVLQQAHLASVNREEERGMVAFTSRRKAIERVGLPEVRQYRLARCAAEENDWQHELQSARQIVPEIRSLLMLRIIKGGAQ